jgi:hypothetical protein
MKKPTSIFSLSNFLSYWTNKLRPESQLHKGNEYRNMNYTTYSRMLVLATTDASPPNHHTHPIHPHGILKELEKYPRSRNSSPVQESASPGIFPQLVALFQNGAITCTAQRIKVSTVTGVGGCSTFAPIFTLKNKSNF